MKSLLITGFVVLSFHIYAQRSRDAISSGDYVGITFEAGITSFFGDIGEGAADGDVLKNNLAYKLQANRNIKSLIDLSGRISFGNMSGEKERSSGGKTTIYYFKNEFIEYTVDLGINLLAIVTKKYNGRFGLYGSVGMGLIDFKTRLYDGSNDSIVQSFGFGDEKSTTEFVLPIGIRAIFHISNSLAISLQTTSSRVDTDKLDGQAGNNNRDYYNYFSAGITYKLPLNLNPKRPGTIRNKRKQPNFKK